MSLSRSGMMTGVDENLCKNPRNDDNKSFKKLKQEYELLF